MRISQFYIFILTILTSCLKIVRYKLAIVRYKVQLWGKKLSSEFWHFLSIVSFVSQFYAIASLYLPIMNTLHYFSKLWVLIPVLNNSQLQAYISQNDFRTRNCEFISHNSEKNVNSEKSQIWEMKSHNYLCIFLIHCQKHAFILYPSSWMTG